MLPGHLKRRGTLSCLTNSPGVPVILSAEFPYFAAISFLLVMNGQDGGVTGGAGLGHDQLEISVGSIEGDLEVHLIQAHIAG